MHRMRLLTLIASAMLLPPGVGVAATVADLTWLAGCWASEDAEPGSGEHWMAPAGGTLLGMGRQVRNGRSVGYEWLRIEETANGSLAYVALPSGQAETRFDLTAIEDTSVVFENPAHDFPQRVAYRLEGDVLHARIEGGGNGAARVIDFPMRRVPCPGG